MKQSGKGNQGKSIYEVGAEQERRKKAAAPQAVPDIFDLRLTARYDELKWLYCELYQGDRNAFSYFLKMLRRCWDARKAPLRMQDAQRESEPGWYRRRDMLGMMLYVDAFAGTLNGTKEKLPYLRECGVNYLHSDAFAEKPEGTQRRWVFGVRLSHDPAGAWDHGGSGSAGGCLPGR